MDTEPMMIVIDGQDFSVTARPGAVGVYDFDWLNHPLGYGFTSAGGPMSRAEMEEAIRHFLAGIDPATGYLD
ncbi:hypothetical protein ACT4S5_09785 [Kocuria oceani]|uniref:hypothetical protein n=1 Tax=Kocuria oceani TaxID=988827 RepID=UPI0040375E73